MNEFDNTNFPPISDPANHDTNKCELYPMRMQDSINEIYGHDKVLYRKASEYTPDPQMGNTGAETVSSFPYKY